jgi:hypothetical protein
MLIVAGLSLRNFKPRVWDPASEHYIPCLRAVMVSYAEFDQFPAKRRQAMELGLRAFLGLPDSVAVYLDNGSFSFARRGLEVSTDAYEEFAAAARPDWRPVPQDFIPSPAMSVEEQRSCIARTMTMNRRFASGSHVPVIHVSALIGEYLDALLADPELRCAPDVGLGGIVPNLLRSPKARPYQEILASVLHARRDLAGKRLHLFGVGGTATLHLAALLGIDSVDSSGWRNRAARGIVQLPGRGDRMVADLGSWRGRTPDNDEWALLEACPCPACAAAGLDGLQARKIDGFAHRATHNLWTLHEEARQISARLADATYPRWYDKHVQNSIYRPLIDFLVGQAPD